MGVSSDRTRLLETNPGARGFRKNPKFRLVRGFRTSYMQWSGGRSVGIGKPVDFFKTARRSPGIAARAVIVYGNSRCSFVGLQSVAGNWLRYLSGAARGFAWMGNSESFFCEADKCPGNTGAGRGCWLVLVKLASAEFLPRELQSAATAY